MPHCWGSLLAAMSLRKSHYPIGYSHLAPRRYAPNVCLHKIFSHFPGGLAAEQRGGSSASPNEHTATFARAVCFFGDLSPAAASTTHYLLHRTKKAHTHATIPSDSPRARPPTRPVTLPERANFIIVA
ncbi:unnamed protein product, partial [Iphiclides podalirius]